MKNFFKLMAASSTILLLIFLQLVSAQPACYVSCAKESCLANNPLLCTGCQVGTILINQRCAVNGFQSQPIRILSPNAQNILATTFLSSDDASRSQVNCSSIRPGQTGVMVFLNITRSKSQTYTFRIPRIIINQPHKFVNLKFNAILFNQRNNPSIKVLVIDQNNRRIFDNIIKANQTVFLCTGATGSLERSSNGFYTTIRMSTETKNILFQISTIQSGDELGVTDIQVFVGNCQLGCATCDGPSSNQCLSCSNLLTYNTEQKACSVCPLGFYKINFQCNSCPYNCQTCQLNTSSGKPICTKCQENIAPNSTIPQCKINNYINQSLTSLKFGDNLGWKSTEVSGNLITVCGIYSLIGGQPFGRGGSSFVKTYTNLPVHSKIWIKFTLFLIDQITGSIYSGSVSVNGKTIFNISQNIDATIMNTSQCGTQKIEYVQIIVIPNIQDSNSDATVQILGLGNYFGIRDFVLGVVNLTQIKNCDKVNSNNQCIRCKNGYSLTPQNINNQTSQCIACPSGYYLKNELCTLCPIYCKTCIQSGNSIVCSSCDQPLKLDTQSGICNDQSDSLYTVGLSQGWANLTSTGWQFYPKLQNKGIDTCGLYSILGSTQIRYRYLNIKKIYSNLPIHQGIILYFYFYQIDDFDGVTNNNNYHTVHFKINNQIIPYKVSTNGYNACGNSTFDSIQKYVLADPKHSSSNLTFQIHGNRTKFGISNLLVFLTNCLDCKNTISYSLDTIPLYSAEAVPSDTQRGLKSKIIFDDKIIINKDLKQLFQVKLVPTSSLLQNSKLSQTINQTNKAKGQNQQYQILAAQLYANRQLRLYQNLFKDEYSKSAIANLLAPDSAYSFVSGSQNLIKSLKLKAVNTTFTRYDDIYSVVNTEQGSGPKYRSNIKNLIKLFRGISILALFIGLLSFFFGLSDKFDDLFVMCQIIFVHVFIQSPWLSATMKLPVGTMNLVQFMAWLPIQGRKSLQNAIIPPDHYQSSPIVYEQYWQDITFSRTIYHTIIFIVVMFIFYWLITLMHQLRKPEINQITHIQKKTYFFIQNYFYKLIKSWFCYLDRIMRFTYFTVMWASCLQFIHFSNQPSGFNGWNSALCIVIFVVYFAYPFLGFYYLNNKASFTQDVTFKQKYDGIRIKKERLQFFVFKYIKWFIIAFIIGQLYNTNPLASLIPLMVIHALDTVFIIIRQPYIDDAGESERIVSRCSKFYWKNYTISHIIQNILFFILQLIMIIMYAIRSSASKAVYLNIGYACCAFIIIMFINALVRLAWGLIRQFQVSLDDIKSKEQQIKTEDEADPINFLELYRNQPVPYDDQNDEQNQRRRPSIDLKIN